MNRHGIPTARHRAFDSFTEAKEYLYAAEGPVVIKASGLAARKGVLMPTSIEEAV